MLSLVISTIIHFRRLLLPVALGVAVSSAVIVGALLVGDSMRGSLQHIALDRIGSMQRFVLAPRWFNEIALEPQEQNSPLCGLMLIQSVVAENQNVSNVAPGTGNTIRATEMALLGVDEAFWRLGSVKPRKQIDGKVVVLNRSLADHLKVSIGDRVTFKVSRDAVVPADSALGKRENEIVALSRWEVVDIIPDESLGRFSLKSDQRPVFNAFASKVELQQALELNGKINAVASSEADGSPILKKVSLTLDDFGLNLHRVHRSFPESDQGVEGDSGKSVLAYDQLTSDQMMIPDPLAEAIQSNTQATRILSYLANQTELLGVDSESKKGRAVPYSIISGAPWELIKHMLHESGEASVSDPSQGSSDDWIVINRWIAKQLDAKVGDRLKIFYYLPETVEGTEVETSFEATVVAIAPLTEPKDPFRRNKPATFSEPPTAFNDPAWTPLVPGITDQESISTWETPFPLTRKIEKQDDEYWNHHRLTPKLFVSDTQARRLFGSRFGSQTSLRFEGLNQQQRDDLDAQILSQARDLAPKLGWRDINLREQQKKAASGTTPFDALFLSLSFFVIAASLILIALLFRLTIEKRAEHWGLLLSSGWTRSKVRSLLLLESTLVAAIGATLGVGFGVLYAYALLTGLKTWWVGAISVSFLSFHINPLSLAIGWATGLIISLGTTWFVSRQLRTSSIARLLKGRMDDELPSSKASRWYRGLAVVFSLAGAIAIFVGQWVQGQAQAGAFVASGMFWMAAILLWIYSSMSIAPSVGENSNVDVLRLAKSNARRAPLRSILTVALMAMASFLILAMSLFQAQPDRRGTGGFSWIGKSAQSIHVNVADSKQQRQVLGEKAQSLLDAMIVPVRVRGGDDASCNNLYQAAEPQVMGVASSIIDADQDAAGKTEFAWFATSTDTSPWKLIDEIAVGSEDDPIPVILDQNTALWALHLGGYVGERFNYRFADRTIYFKTVGVLQNTVLQGSLWIGERNFQNAFPDVGGYRTFLIKPKLGVAKDRLDEIRYALEWGWADEGMSCASAEGVLSRLLAVQNTYLSAFQLLGGIGLLLGTLGLGVSQLRSALERKSELAAMRAIGFPKRRLIWTLFLENGWQLFRGLGIGIVCALAASAPVLLRGNSTIAILGPLSMLSLVIVAGLVFCSTAAALAMKEPLLGSLRSDR